MDRKCDKRRDGDGLGSEIVLRSCIPQGRHCGRRGDEDGGAGQTRRPDAQARPADASAQVVFQASETAWGRRGLHRLAGRGSSVPASAYLPYSTALDLYIIMCRPGPWNPADDSFETSVLDSSCPEHVQL